MEEKTLTPCKAIRAKCLDCCCWQASEVRLCAVMDCPLHPFRMGHNPNINRKGRRDINDKIRTEKNAAE